MKMEHKTAVPFHVKEISTAKRTFGGLASAFNGVDDVGDTVMPGAYRETIEEHRRSGEPIYLLDQHQYQSIRNVLGKVSRIAETGSGLEVEFKVVDSPDGAELMARIQEGMIRAMSIGYRVRDHAPAEVGGKRVRLLKNIDLKEISAVIWPADPRAVIAPGSMKIGPMLEVPTGYAPGSPRREALEDRLRTLQVRHLETVAKDQEETRRLEREHAAREERIRNLLLGAQIRRVLARAS